MTEPNKTASSEGAAEEQKSDLSDLESERPAGEHDTEELSFEQIQELLKTSAAS